MIRICKEDFLAMFKTIDTKTGKYLLSTSVKENFTVTNIQRSKAKNRYVPYYLYYKFLQITGRTKDLQKLIENHKA